MICCFESRPAFLTRLLYFALIASALGGGACYGQAHTEIGTLGHTSFRIDVPKAWNGILVIYCHGYSMGPVVFRQTENRNSRSDALVSVGYAVAESGYEQGGWALSTDLQNNDSLTNYFVSHYPKPRMIIVVGESFGGFLSLISMEKPDGRFDAGLALCAPAGAASLFMGRRVFDFLVVFDHYFPGMLPSPDSISDKAISELPTESRISDSLKGNPDGAAAVRLFSGIHKDVDIAANARFFTYILYDLEKRCGGNPFSNTNVLYQGSPDDVALNRGVLRVGADPNAARCLADNYTPTGELRSPLLMVSTTYDPLIPAWVSNSYITTVAAAGKSSLLIDQFVVGEGHCAISDKAVVDAVTSLSIWKKTGVPPAAALRP